MTSLRKYHHGLRYFIHNHDIYVTQISTWEQRKCELRVHSGQLAGQLSQRDTVERRQRTVGAVQDAVWLLLCNPLRVRKQLGLKDLLKERVCDLSINPGIHRGSTRGSRACVSHLHQLHWNLICFSVCVWCLEEDQIQQSYYITWVVSAGEGMKKRSYEVMFQY